MAEEPSGYFLYRIKRTISLESLDRYGDEETALAGLRELEKTSQSVHGLAFLAAFGDSGQEWLFRTGSQVSDWHAHACCRCRGILLSPPSVGTSRAASPREVFKEKIIETSGDRNLETALPSVNQEPSPSKHIQFYFDGDDENSLCGTSTREVDEFHSMPAVSRASKCGLRDDRFCDGSDDEGESNWSLIHPLPQSVDASTSIERMGELPHHGQLPGHHSPEVPKVSSETWDDSTRNRHQMMTKSKRQAWLRMPPCEGQSYPMLQVREPSNSMRRPGPSSPHPYTLTSYEKPASFGPLFEATCD